MCGIAAYSTKASSGLDTALLTKLFIAGLAERGEDACGYAYRGRDGRVHTVKRALPPYAFLATVPLGVPDDVHQGIVHVRDHTKGRPTHNGNNHPISHGAITGVHNGIIQNDDQLFARYRRERSLPGMTVDSEAIFMLADVTGSNVSIFDELVGSYATAWFDERHPELLHIARGRARPLVLAQAPGVTIAASTRHAVDFAAERLGIPLKATSVQPGTMITLSDGEVVDRTRFRVQPFTERSTTTYSRDHHMNMLANRVIDEHGEHQVSAG